MQAQQLLHRILGLLCITLVITGALLHAEALRGPLSELRQGLRGAHLVSGVLFSVAFIANFPYFWQSRQGKPGGLNRREYLGLLALTGICWLISGVGLLAATRYGFAGSARSAFYSAHLFCAATGTLIVLPHLLAGAWLRLHCFSRREDGDQGVRETDEGRRSLLRFIIGGLLFAGVGAAWRWMGQQAARVKSETLDVFDQCNKMTPAPLPLPDSSPPRGGGYTGRFKVYKVGPQIPCADSKDWHFTIDGLVERPRDFRWPDFLRLPRTVQVSDFHCVDGWSVYRITYEGVRLSDLLELAGVRPQAKFIRFLSAEGIYTESLSLEQARLPDVMAAVLLDGREIPSDLGGPLRLVVPQMYAYKAVKWLVGMELTEALPRGYWEDRGYPVDAWVRK